MKRPNFVSEDQSQNEVSQILPAASALRIASLARVGQLSNAKEKHYRREEKRAVDRYGEASPQALNFKRRGELQRQFSIQNSVQVQREKVAAVSRDEAAFAILGRVTDGVGMGHSGLTVSAIGADGKPIDYACTDENGAFRLSLPADDSMVATLLVSDSKRKILYRGSEVLRARSGGIVYRELALDETVPCVPTPPPDKIPETVTVPSLLGRTEAEAQRLLKATGLGAKSEPQEANDDQVGKVVRQSPEANASVSPGSVVTIGVGILRTTVTVPKLIGLRYAQARESLKASRLTLGSVTPPHPKPDALVIGQSPDEGNAVAANTAVDLKLQAEPETPSADMVTVPNLVGQNVKRTQQILKRAKLRFGKARTQPSSKEENGLIIEQIPAAKASVQAESKVDVVVGRVERTRPKAPSGIDAVLANVAKDPAFNGIAASESKIRRIAEERKLKTKSDAQKLAKAEDKDVRDTFKLKNLAEAKTLKKLISKSLKKPK